MLIVGTENHGLNQSHDYGRSWTELAETVSAGPVIAVRVLAEDAGGFAVTIVSSDAVHDWRVTSGNWISEREFAFANDSPMTAVALGTADAAVNLVAGFLDGTIQTLMMDQ